MMVRNGTGALTCRIAGGSSDEQQQRGADQRQDGQAEIGAEEHQRRQQHVGALDDLGADDGGQHTAGHDQRDGAGACLGRRHLGRGEAQMLGDAEAQAGEDGADAVDLEVAASRPRGRMSGCRAASRRTRARSQACGPAGRTRCRPGSTRSWLRSSGSPSAAYSATCPPPAHGRSVRSSRSGRTSRRSSAPDSRTAAKHYDSSNYITISIVCWLGSVSRSSLVQRARWRANHRRIEAGRLKREKPQIITLLPGGSMAIMRRPMTSPNQEVDFLTDSELYRN